MIYVEREELDYVPFYCEENVWRLLQRPELEQTRAWALLVSNAERRVLFLRQRSGRPVDGLVQWDYHVVALVDGGNGGYLVFDPDADLQFPSPLAAYLEASFPSDVSRARRPSFRAVSARDYVAGLVSDRSHMRRSDGSYLAPPPPWEPPGHGRREGNNLMTWVDLNLKKPGRVMSLDVLRSIAQSARCPDRRLP